MTPKYGKDFVPISNVCGVYSFRIVYCLVSYFDHELESPVPRANADHAVAARASTAAFTLTSCEALAAPAAGEELKPPHHFLTTSWARFEGAWKCKEPTPKKRVEIESNTPR